MIIYHLKELIHRKAIKENRKLTYDIIMQETGVSRGVLAKMASIRKYHVSTDSLERLCNYFECGCSELVSIFPDQDQDSDQE